MAFLSSSSLEDSFCYQQSQSEEQPDAMFVHVFIESLAQLLQPIRSKVIACCIMRQTKVEDTFVVTRNRFIAQL